MHWKWIWFLMPCKNYLKVYSMSSKIKILFVDDEEIIRRRFSKTITNEIEGLVVETASEGEDALNKLKTFAADIVITDVRMPKMDGVMLLEEIKLRYPDIFVLVTTAYGTVEDAVKVMKAGAYDYLLKPFDLDMTRMVIKKITDHKKILQENVCAGKNRRKGYRFHNILGQDTQMFEIFQVIKDVAKTRATVLITGESGTGKELVAEAIHYESSRRENPLIRVNCAAFTETLINSELFGHEKGAFTGATARKKGLFEMAHGGTAFLDEIGDISR